MYFYIRRAQKIAPNKGSMPQVRDFIEITAIQTQNQFGCERRFNLQQRVAPESLRVEQKPRGPVGADAANAAAKWGQDYFTSRRVFP